MAFFFSFFGSSLASVMALMPAGFVGAAMLPVLLAGIVADPLASGVVAIRLAAGTASPQLTKLAVAEIGQPIGPGGKVRR